MELRKFRWVVGVLLGAGSLTGCQLFAPGPPLETVSSVDIARYMGTWYEIAKYPNGFEQGCFGVTAEYTLRDDGTVRVVNVCRNADGTRNERNIEGFATVADATTNSKLTVYFFFPFGAPYWIIDLDEDYQYAVVGDPSRTFLWILSRTPTLDEATYQGILDRLPAKGYDPARLELMPQFPAQSP
ncbi:Outer membrane lipoprotein Blc precursor [Phycisphaerae bacterium RAS2]|nr:Outer membrane lipoprotein Blc precursor [Phycisphaerae bacterium RAS2]